MSVRQAVGLFLCFFLTELTSCTIMGNYSMDYNFKKPLPDGLKVPLPNEEDRPSLLFYLKMLGCVYMMVNQMFLQTLLMRIWNKVDAFRHFEISEKNEEQITTLRSTVAVTSRKSRRKTCEAATTPKESLKQAVQQPAEPIIVQQKNELAEAKTKASAEGSTKNVRTAMHILTPVATSAPTQPSKKDANKNRKTSLRGKLPKSKTDEQPKSSRLPRAPKGHHADELLDQEKFLLGDEEGADER